MGANVVTENKMFIGRLIQGKVESDPSNASTHWWWP